MYHCSTAEGGYDCESTERVREEDVVEERGVVTSTERGVDVSREDMTSTSSRCLSPPSE